MVDESQENEWLRMTRDDPEHSSWYIARFRAKAAAGEDLTGEARMIDTMVERGARILDAGCGPGRVGGHLADVGHQVVGVDIDPELIAAARHDHPGPLWLLDDLASFDPGAHGIDDGFDAIVCAGNVMTFLAPGSRREVLARFRSQLRPGGRAAVGFGTNRGYEVDDFLDDVRATGLHAEVLLSTWSLHPYEPGDDFLVALLGIADPASDAGG